MKSFGPKIGDFDLRQVGPRPVIIQPLFIQHGRRKLYQAINGQIFMTILVDARSLYNNGSGKLNTQLRIRSNKKQRIWKKFKQRIICGIQ
jgi:hypothetical protein